MVEHTKNIVVIYKSKYGSTKRYAEWIASNVNADLFEISTISLNDLQKYDTIIFGGSLHAAGIKGVKIITDNFKQLMNKKIIVFAVGCSPGRKDAINHVLYNNFTNDMKERVNFFYLRGAFNYKKLGFIDKIMMSALKSKLKRMKKEELDEDSRGLLECYDNPVDWTDKKTIIPIIECII
ncbi:flavodoxin [Clostridium polyendosporum]|uniref:Flavodoxin n=1 Tax=Clostridium polyendosporum TaxID=69208 RepID=A0A919S100_9CLOT|nr:flavodoxin domain-containing protein [Clostridium polyendosporum]GIM29278.1 flavodoxin [Clostridium polyendosporum]